ncbi:MAG TPA: sigma-70 family RNA polymerase sigma factor [Polyangiaceae bacterium]|jgi:RNA polymerase sigma factor (sigma-70 family)
MGKVAACDLEARPRAAEGLVVSSWERDVVRASRAMARRVGGTRRGDDGDFAQEARTRLLIAFRARGTMPKGYGRRIVRNAVVSAVRRVLRGQRFEANDIDVDSVEEAAENDGWAHATSRTVASLIANLPERMRRVYDLLYEQDLSQREAAARLSLTQPRVAQLHRELLEHARALLIAA